MFSWSTIMWTSGILFIVWLIYKIRGYVLNFIGFQSFHATIRHVMSIIQINRSKPFNQGPKVNFNTLTLHILSKYPLIEVTPQWSLIFYNEFNETLLFTVKRLNLVFIVETDKPIKKTFEFTKTRLDNGRVVTFVMKQMYYHMYYSSDDYTEPDAVLIYNNTSTMLEKGEDLIHTDISYRNMTAKRGVFLVLLDNSGERLLRGIRILEQVRPDKKFRVLDHQHTPQTNYYFSLLKRE